VVFPKVAAHRRDLDRVSFDDVPDMKAYQAPGEVELDMEKLWKDIGEDTVPPAITEQRKARAAVW
jgi:hypothetical protein